MWVPRCDPQGPALRAHRQRQKAEGREFGDGYRDTGYLFTNLNGDPLAPDRLTRTFRKLSVEAGLPPIRLHDLRHGAATLALAAGVAHVAAEKVASLILKAGRLVPGTTRTRRRPPIRPKRRNRKRGGRVSGGRGGRSRAHPGRPIGHRSRRRR